MSVDVLEKVTVVSKIDNLLSVLCNYPPPYYCFAQIVGVSSF